VRLRFVLVMAALGFLALPAGAADDRDIPIGQTLTLHSTALGEERTVFVHTPFSYESGARFPVLYLTDGEAQFLHTVGTVEFLVNAGRISPLIVVGVTNAGGDRTRDLTPTHASLGLGARQDPEPTSGGADRFLQFLEKELIPHIENTYRTLPFRIFAGHSFGGLFALHVLTTRPDLFGGVIAVSPTLSWDHDLPLKKVRELLDKRSELRSTVFVTMGNEGAELDKRLAELKRMLGRGKAKGFSSGVMSFPDEDHGSVVLLSHYHGLQKIYEGWQMPRDPATGFPAGGLDAVKAHYRKLTERFGFTVVPSEAAVNQVGYAELAAKRLDKAIEAFRFNVKVYPESANTYDSLGEALEAKGERQEALDSYRKAVAQARKTSDRALPLLEKRLAAAEERLRPK